MIMVIRPHEGLHMNCFFLLVYVCIKFSAKNNKTPSQTTHNSLLEVAWTLIPVLILVVIAIPSFRLLYKQNDFEY